MRSTVSFPVDLAGALARSARAFGIPGLAVAVLAPGRQALLLDGVAAPGGPAVNHGTWVSVASLGKHVTAAAVLDLAQRGRVNLTAAIGHYLPTVPSAWADRSVLSLLRHSGGLAEYLSAAPEQPVPTTLAGFMAQYARLAPAFDEGAGWMYTNTHYILLGMLVAQASGARYAQAVQALFQRMGCPHATVAGPAWAREANRATTHDAHRLGTTDPDTATREVIGDGDVCFTPAGALRWLEVLLDGGLLDGAHEDLMFTAGPLATGRPSGYGCGWFVEPMGETTIAHHGGHFDGWTAMTILNRARGSGVVAMCNQAPGHTRAIRHLAQQALEGFAPGATPLSLPVLADPDPVLTQRIRSQLLREPGTAPDLSCLADELRRVAEHGSPVRTVPNLHAGLPPQAFDLVQRQVHDTHTWHRYRLSYQDRVEHVLVGTTPDRRIFWAWAL
jgi:CubicO group peptidase (beta-lactamase class C family)